MNSKKNRDTVMVEVLAVLSMLAELAGLYLGVSPQVSRKSVAPTTLFLVPDMARLDRNA